MTDAASKLQWSGYAGKPVAQLTEADKARVLALWKRYVPGKLKHLLTAKAKQSAGGK